jgi:hypothetical protein
MKKLLAIAFVLFISFIYMTSADAQTVDRERASASVIKWFSDNNMDEFVAKKIKNSNKDMIILDDEQNSGNCYVLINVSEYEYVCFYVNLKSGKSTLITADELEYTNQPMNWITSYLMKKGGFYPVLLKIQQIYALELMKLDLTGVKCWNIYRLAGMETFPYLVAEVADHSFRKIDYNPWTGQSYVEDFDKDRLTKGLNDFIIKPQIVLDRIKKTGIEEEAKRIKWEEKKNALLQQRANAKVQDLPRIKNYATAWIYAIGYKKAYKYKDCLIRCWGKYLEFYDKSSRKSEYYYRANDGKVKKTFASATKKKTSHDEGYINDVLKDIEKLANSRIYNSEADCNMYYIQYAPFNEHYKDTSELFYMNRKDIEFYWKDLFPYLY